MQPLQKGKKMARDSQMLIVRQQVNQLIEECALAAERGGALEVRKLKIPETAELPPGRGVVVSADYAATLAKQAAENERNR
jgi:hypothetical protein